MTSYLIDLALVLALAATSWRTGAMYRELRRLRAEKASFEAVLKAADASINQAAHAVVLLKSEGVRTLRSLEERTHEAREQVERLDLAIRSADLRFALAEAGGSFAGLAPASRDARC